MANRFSRKQIVLVASVLVLLGLGGYGLWQTWPRFTNPYYGLTTHIDVQMEDSTRTLIEQRLSTAQASLAAQTSVGGSIDNQLYLVIAENQKMLGDLVASRKMYEEYLELMPSSYVAWNSYAKLLELMRDLPNAEAAHKKVIELLQVEEYYRDYIEFLLAHYPERQVDVKVLLDEAYTKFLQTPWTMTALGDWYFAAGDCQQGEAHYDVAISLSPDTASTLERDQQEMLEACAE